MLVVKNNQSKFIHYLSAVDKQTKMTVLEISRKKRHQKKSEYRLFCVEGDGVLVKTNSGGDEKHNTDLSHFLIHTMTNLDNGKGHTRCAFQNIQKSLKINYHEHF